jgi:hypothetical protein
LSGWVCLDAARRKEGREVEVEVDMEMEVDMY